MRMANKMKGQYFSFDAIVATVIMVLAATTLVAYWFGVQSVVESRNNPMYADASRIAESLLSPGVPGNWQVGAQENGNLAGAWQVGLAKDYSNLNELDKEKISALRLLAETPDEYDAVGRIMRAPAQYYILIEQVGCTGEECGTSYEIGNSHVLDAETVVVAHRGAVLEGKPVRVRVFLGK